MLSSQLTDLQRSFQNILSKYNYWNLLHLLFQYFYSMKYSLDVCSNNCHNKYFVNQALYQIYILDISENHLIKAANFHTFYQLNLLVYNSYSLIYLLIKNTLDYRLHILNLKVDQNYRKMLNQD